MLLILPVPLGADTTVRRLPWATFALIALSVVIHVLVGFADDPRADLELEAKLERMASWELKKASDDDTELGRRVESYPSALAFLSGEPDWQASIPDDAIRVRLAGYLDDYGEIVRGHPYYRFGFVPAEPSPVRLFAHMFLHADVIHLGFNMLFLYIAGGVLEDRWGVPLYLALYLGLGIAAAGAHWASAPLSVEPAIGASGAIAGLMGAFAVQQARTPIRIVLVYTLGLMPRTREMTVPAVALLVAWLLQQLFMASMTANSKANEVAFGAHIGGFVAGCLVAVVLRAVATGELADRIRKT